jgi:hypothetical protein
MEEQEKLSEGQCNKDSDCASGYVCVNGKCVPDIGSTTKSEDEVDG